MDSSHGVIGSRDESNSRKEKFYHRHTQHQTQWLEVFFKEYPHPKDAQRKQLSMKLGLTPQQIMFWFQNKKTQIKIIKERSYKDTLRGENDRFHRENMSMLEVIRNTTCPQGSSSSDQPQSLQALRIENLRLREELQRQELAGRLQEVAGVDNLQITQSSPYPSSWVLEKMMDRSLIIETAISAMNELIELLHVNDPMWTISPGDGRSTIHSENYDKIFPKTSHFKSTNARIESSKDFGEVAMGGAQLVEVFMDPIKWMDMFPTIVTKAKTFEVVDTSTMFRNGSMRLMYEEMHNISPLVAPREFFFIRYIQHIAPTAWMIVDVSYDFIKQLHDTTTSRAWKLPSGCLIQDKPNGKSLVTWIEHVEVDEKSSTFRLYRDLASYAYGAKRWITTLKRMCDRVACSLGLAITPRDKLEGVINSPEGRRNLMKLSHRMVKSLSRILNMSDTQDFTHLPQLNNNGVRVSVRISSGTSQSNGFIIVAVTSFLLPLSVQDLFHFFNDETRRHQWDALSAKNPVSAIARISTGIDPGNCISIIQPFILKENLLILQESSIDSLGASLVYAPVNLPSITKVVDGEDATRVQILPSRYLISGAEGHGSILTIALQILACHTSMSHLVKMKSVATVHSLISFTAQRIKATLGCPDLD